MPAVVCRSGPSLILHDKVCSHDRHIESFHHRPRSSARNVLFFQAGRDWAGKESAAPSLSLCDRVYTMFNAAKLSNAKLVGNLLLLIFVMFSCLSVRLSADTRRSQNKAYRWTRRNHEYVHTAGNLTSKAGQQTKPHIHVAYTNKTPIKAITC